MCWKKILDWWLPEPVIPVTGSRVALLFAIDDYPGSQNDLPDCVMDQNRIADFLSDYYPEFIVKKFKNSDVTRSNFRNAIVAQREVMKAGDILFIHYSGHGTNGPDASEPDGMREGLYLYDGTYWDDEFTSILQDIPAGQKIIIALDSCFAHGSTTPKNSKLRFKFVPTVADRKGIKRFKRILRNDEMDYIVFAACCENQTAASTGSGGAFTIFFVQGWERTFNYQEWNDMTAALLLATHEFDQIPNIEGNETLINEQIFT